MPRPVGGEVHYLRAQNVDVQKRCFVFIDEIHYLDNPSSFLKVLHDHFPLVKLIVSGSSSLEIKRKFKETLIGRKIIFEVSPLSFEEFLLFKKSPLSRWKERFNLPWFIQNADIPDLSEVKFLFADLNKLFSEFLVFGGYPGVVLKESFQEKTTLLYEIYSSYVHKDIRDLGAVENVSAFNRMVELLGNQIGNLVNLSELTPSLAISRPTLENNLFLLEHTFVIKRVKPFFTNRRQEIIKTPKVFFCDTGIRNALVRNFETPERRADSGALFENGIFAELHKKLASWEDVYFWRTKSKAEVDFVIRLKGKEVLPIEVKHSLPQPKIPSGLRSFVEKYKPPLAFVVNRNLFEGKKLGPTRVYFIHPWAI